LGALRNKNIWKMLSAGVIICAAFAIMLPDLVKYLFGISRLIVCIALILFGAGLLGVVTSWRAREKLRAEKSENGGE
jgi:hypothetical protein